MPVIIIKGHIKNKAKVKQYIEQLCCALKINRMRAKVIFIRFHAKLKNDFEGLCWGDMDEGFVEIDIAKTTAGSKLPYESIMQTLAHEMVHAKQYFRGELNPVDHSWKGGKPYKYEYDNAPWEIEAYAREERLYKKCWKKD